jgi:uncharacterized OB-fold protein
MTETLLKAFPSGFVALNPDLSTKPLWAAAAEGRLVGARCPDCGAFRHPPTPYCAACEHSGIDWKDLSGRGTIYTFTVVRRLPLPNVEFDLPYVIAVVQPDDAPGARFVGNIVGCRLEEVRFGAPVEICWVKDGERTLPHWQLAKPEATVIKN